jgi:hypothetical protein
LTPVFIDAEMPLASMVGKVRVFTTERVTLIVPLIVTVPVARMTVPLGIEIVPLMVRLTNSRLAPGGLVFQSSPFAVVNVPSDPEP